MVSMKKTVTEPVEKPTFAERFAKAYVASMKEENEEASKAPKKFKADEAMIDVVDPDDKHMG